MRIAAPLVNLLMNYAECRAVDRTALEALLDKPIDLCDDKESISVEEYERILNALNDKLNDDKLGLSYGRYLNLSALGIAYKVSLAATSLTQAFQLLEGYLKNNFPLVTIKHQEAEGKVKMWLLCSIKDKVLNTHVLESTFMFMYRELCSMMDKEVVRPVIPQGNKAEYEEQIGANVINGAGYGFEINAAAIADGINKRNIRKIEILLPQFLLMLGAKNDKSFAAATRDMILHMCTPELPTLQEVCRQFAMSDRTFQRKLNNEGASYRDITNKIKMQLAAYLHAGDKMKTQDIAHILGYSESSAYLHAAKSWNS
ncbi:MAG: AraC family transcriptional regulator ligand-binding domain-containing protein [Flavipsychrobacter sp.]